MFMNKIIMDIDVSKELSIDNLDSNEINIKKDAKLTINVNCNKYTNYEFNLDDNSILEINKFYNNSGINENITINLNGINSKVIYNFNVLTTKDETYTININHNNKNTISKIINHGVVLNDSKLSFIVNSTVLKGNDNSKLDQDSKIIVMGRNNSEIKPNLFIDEFDVEARHAASIGKFSKEEIFYLMTKGISYDDANKLLINGFLGINGGE